MRYLCILEVLMKKKEQLAEFFAFNDVKRLNSVFRMSSQWQWGLYLIVRNDKSHKVMVYNEKGGIDAHLLGLVASGDARDLPSANAFQILLKR